MKLGKNKLHKPKRIIIIPDLQGKYFLFLSLWEKIEKEIKEGDHIVFLGDYIGFQDNINLLLKLQEIKNNHENVFFICGNHDDSFLSFLKNNTKFIDYDFLKKELSNYGIKKFNNHNVEKFLKLKNINFIFNLIHYYETDKFLLTHAPIDNNILSLYKISEGVLDQMNFDLMYNFIEEENSPVFNIDKWLVNGHQNLYKDQFDKSLPRMSPTIYPESKRIYLDTKQNLFSIILPSKKIIKANI